MIVASLISYPQAIVLGLLQGVAELFPISSLGQSVILPNLLGWNIHQNDKYFVSFLVATHLAQASRRRSMAVTVDRSTSSGVAVASTISSSPRPR